VNKLLLISALAVGLSACGTTNTPRVVVQEVLVPVPCSPKIPSKPLWAVDALSLDAEIDEQMRALRADRIRANAYIKQLEVAFYTCQ
jgi:hypothetical protein